MLIWPEVTAGTEGPVPVPPGVGVGGVRVTAIVTLAVEPLKSCPSGWCTHRDRSQCAVVILVVRGELGLGKLLLQRGRNCWYAEV